MFDYSLDYKNIDFRANPHLYRVGKGEQGVLLVEPYKSEMLPFWRFKTPEIARESSEKIYALFLTYKEQQDFVGMDMARKFLQMGYTRARRYANHRSGKKYEPQQEGAEVQAGKNGYAHKRRTGIRARRRSLQAYFMQSISRQRMILSISSCCGSIRHNTNSNRRTHSAIPNACGAFLQYPCTLPEAMRTIVTV